LDQVERYLLALAGFSKVSGTGSLTSDNLTQVFQTAEAERLVPQLWRAVSHADGIQGEVRRAIQTFGAYFAARALLLRHLLTECVAALEAEGVPCCPLKGVVLATRLYGDPTRRQSGDIDLLVAPHDQQRAVAVLEQLGYRQELAFVAGLDHHLSMLRPLGESIVKLELHTAVNFGNEPRFPRTWWDARVSLDMDGCMVPFFRDDHLLVFLCLHVAVHGFASWGWLNDIADLLSVMRCDNEQVVRAAAEAGLERPVYYALWFIHKMGRAQVDPALLMALRPRRDRSQWLWFLIVNGRRSRAQLCRWVAILALSDRSQQTAQYWFVPSYAAFRRGYPQLSDLAARLLYAPWLARGSLRAGVELVRAGVGAVRSSR
jgi:hypothetical protein